ncbi:MAG: class I mannose-6-phosphate isomerase [Firmicutes bacterium]|nr:class I mannose-6-phosphate isomerase [Bacillota bacterium]
MIHEYIWGTEDWLFQDEELLIKRIDARDMLSVQVHPDDVYARDHGLDRGKTECWYVVSSRPGAFLYCGFGDEKNVGKTELKEAIEDGSIEKYLSKIFVEPGDFIYIPAGTVHAIGAGIQLLEVQQNSTTTYRLYDYKRKDASGNERELHVKEGLECLRMHTPCGKYELPFECSYFTVDRSGDFLIVTCGEKRLSIPVE